MDGAEARSPVDPRTWSVSTWAWVAAGIAILVYIPSLWNGLAYDDVVIIADNANLRSWRNWGDLLTAPYWPTEHGRALGAWRPTTTLVLSIVWQISGGAAMAFHAANVLLHAAATVLVVLVAARIVSVTAAGLAGVIFAVHPVHVEAVANGVGIAELLAAVFVLAALHLLLGRRRPGGARLGLAMLLFALGFGAKESAVVLPGLLFVADAVRDRLRPRDLGGWLRDRAAALIGLTVVSGLMLWARGRLLDGIASTLPPFGASLLEEVPRIWTLGEVWYQMLRVLMLPSWLSPDYSPDLIPVVLWWTPRGTVGVLGVLSVLGFGWIAARHLSGVREDADRGRAADWTVGTVFGVGWFVVALSPVANVLFLTGILLAERTLYLPSVGVAVLFGSLLSAPLVRRGSPRPIRLAALVVAGFLLMAWTTRSLTYIPVWKDNSALFSYMATYIPESARSQLFRGAYRATQGDEEGALAHYRVALRRANPSYALLLDEGLNAMELDMLEVARVFLLYAAAVGDAEATPRSLLADVALRREDWERAEYWGREAVEVDPDELTGWFQLSTALARQERWAEAAEARESVARLDPAAWQPWYGVAEFRARAGDLQGARAAADSVRVRSEDPEVAERIDELLATLTPGAG